MGKLHPAFKVILFFTIGLVVMYLVYNNQNQAFIEDCALKGIPDKECSLLDKIIADFKSVKIIWLVIVVLAFMLSNIARALRWGLMLDPLGYNPKSTNLFYATMIGYFANLGIPRSGEVLKVATLSKYENIPFEKIMGTVVLDRLMDMFCLLIVLIISVLLTGDKILNYILANSGLKDFLEKNPNLIYYLIGMSVLGLAIMFLARRYLANLAIYKKLEVLLKGFFDGLLSIRKLKKPLLFIVYSVFIWTMYYLMTFLCFFAFAPTMELGPIAGLTVFIFGTLGIIIPTPGGMGSYHFLVTEALKIYGLGEADGFSFANIIFFSIQIFCNILFGVISLIMLPLSNRDD